MKKYFYVIVALLCFTLSAVASDFSVVNADGKTIYYTITSSAPPYTVEMSRNNYGYSDSVNIPASVTYNGVTYSVTSIGNDAFNSSRDLTSVLIPSSITAIGSYAFYECISLTSVSIPSSVTTI